MESFVKESLDRACGNSRVIGAEKEDPKFSEWGGIRQAKCVSMASSGRELLGCVPRPRFPIVSKQEL